MWNGCRDPVHGRPRVLESPKVLWTGGAKVALRWGSSRVLWTRRGPAWSECYEPLVGHNETDRSRVPQCGACGDAQNMTGILNLVCWMRTERISCAR